MPELTAPKPEQYALTEDKVLYFRRHAKSGWRESCHIISIVCFSVTINAFLPHSITESIHVFWRLLGLGYVLFWLGSLLLDKYYAHFKANPDYVSFQEYEKALSDYNDLARKLRWEDRRRRKKQWYAEKAKEEWWRGIDGHAFELEVAKLLFNKGYDVEHTGNSSGGDEGVDLVLKKDNRKIIIQCKAFKNYLSAGVVRELYGTLIHQKADEAWLVTTSGYYSGAKQFAQGKPIKLLTIRQLIALSSVK